jgi:hypothetical protein
VPSRLTIPIGEWGYSSFIGEDSSHAIKANETLHAQGAAHILLVDHELASLNLCGASTDRK